MRMDETVLLNVFMCSYKERKCTDVQLATCVRDRLPCSLSLRKTSHKWLV